MGARRVASPFLSAGVPLLTLVVFGHLGLTKILQGRQETRDAKQKAMLLRRGRGSDDETDLDEELQRTLGRISQEMKDFEYKNVEMKE